MLNNVYTLIFVAGFNKITYKHVEIHHHGPGGRVEQGHGGAHHVDGRVVHIMLCTCLYPNFCS